jgi:lipopolysaccharide transport system ATP-binding protein
VLFVSHNLAAVKSLCTRGLLLDNGRLEMDGTSEAVVGRYIALHEEALSGERRHRIESDPTWKDTSRGFFLYPRGERAEMAVDCGDDIVLEFEVESPKDLEEATVGIVVVTTAGEKIASMSSKVQNVASAPGPSRRWSVRCDMGRLPLNAGIYRLHVYFGNGGFDFARFTSALAIKVREHDVFGWGNPLPPVESWGSIYWEPRWEIAPARRAAVFTAASPLVEVE